MKRAFIAGLMVCCVSVSGCALMSWGEDPYGATLHVQETEVLLSSGSRDVLGGTLFLWGTDLRVNEPSCRVVATHLECGLPKIPERKNYVLPVAGSNIVAQAVVERSSGRFWAQRP